jgi:hypothetical protein
MSPTVWIVFTVVVVAVVAVAIWLVYARRRKSAELRGRFGPEYDRVLQERGEARRAEQELQARTERVEQLHIRPLSSEESRHYGDDWREVQAQFVDDPEAAIQRADHLVMEVMQARGYPMADFDQRVADISVDHPREVEHYRVAHGIASRAVGGSVSTEELRQAMVHYRALFEDLIEGRQAVTTEARP